MTRMTRRTSAGPSLTRAALTLGRACGAALLAIAFAGACSSETPTGEPDVDPCTQLGEICPYCKNAGDQEECQQALASADDTQCAAILGQASIESDCVPRDGGAAVEAGPVDAAPLGACGSTASADAGCECKTDCSPACSGGGCDFTCAGGNCTPTCAGGGCHVTCESGATCEGSCAGGDCTVDCKAGSMCFFACPGGGCTFQCEDNAVCMDTCGSATSCIGM